MSAQTPTQRSLARFARAAAIIPPITLDAKTADALRRAQAASGESCAALVRRLIVEAAGPTNLMENAT